MSAPERSSADARRHRALASPVRRDLLEAIQETPGVSAAVLTDRVDLHVNTVRSHLHVLEDAGLIEPMVEERSRPGRPRLLYRAVGTESPGPASDDQGGYRFLSEILASYLGATSTEPAGEAERAGAAWGSFVVAKPAPFTDLAPFDGIDRLVSMLQEVGFDPAIEETASSTPRLLLRRCPFLEVARDHQDVVCSVHLGLMRGALAELGVEVVAEELLPWADPGGCVAHLRLGATGA